MLSTTSLFGAANDKMSSNASPSMPAPSLIAADSHLNTMQLQLISIVKHSLQHHLIANALFYAERLHVMQPCETSLYWLTYSHWMNGDYATAQNLIARATADEQSQRLRFIWAQCCFKLEMFTEVDRILVSMVKEWENDASTLQNGSDMEGHPDASAVYYLLSRSLRFVLFCAMFNRTTIFRELRKLDRAIAFARKAIELNPWLFSALEDLLELGVFFIPEFP